MIMDQQKDEDKSLVFNNFIEEDGKIWFWATNYNALFQCSITGGIAKNVWGLAVCEDAAGSLYSKIVKFDNKIIGIPMLSDKILVYDTSTGDARMIPIPAQDWGNPYTLERGRFWDGVVYDKYVFMIGFWSTKILKFDVVNEVVVDVLDLYDEMDIPLIKRYLSFKNAVLVNSRILIPAYTRNYVFILNPMNMQYEKLVIEKCGNGFSGIAYDGEDIWLSPRERGQFVQWRIQQNTVILHDNYPTEFKLKESANISCIEYCNGKIYELPYMANKVISLKKTVGKVIMQTEDAFNSYYEGLGTHNEITKYLFVQRVGMRLYSYCTESRRVLTFDTESGLLSELRFQISEEDYLFFIMRRWGITEEHGNLSLFIESLYDYIKQSSKVTEKSSTGEVIYNKIKECLE